MSAKDFTDYIIEKADDVIDIREEIETELANFDGSLDDFINDAVETFRTRLVELAESLEETFEDD